MSCMATLGPPSQEGCLAQKLQILLYSYRSIASENQLIISTVIQSIRAKWFMAIQIAFFSIFRPIKSVKLLKLAKNLPRKSQRCFHIRWKWSFKSLINRYFWFLRRDITEKVMRHLTAFRNTKEKVWRQFEEMVFHSPQWQWQTF
jgi:hypothetical protein